MRVRLSPDLRHRPEPFGGTVYVHARNDFFFLDTAAYRFVSRIKPSWVAATPDGMVYYKKLARLGICQTENPSVKSECYRGSAFVGHFEDIPKVSKPLVL